MYIEIRELILICGVVFFACLAVLRVVGIIRLKKYSSPLLGIVEVWQRFNGERSLTINRYTHGISINRDSINKSYWYGIAKLVWVHCKGQLSPQVLFLGLGANTSSNLIAKENPDIHQTIIEIDSSIITANEQYFGLRSLPNHTLLQGDAYELIDNRPDFKGKFDVIVIDVFTGNPPYVSTRSDKPTFIQKILEWTKPHGLLIFNRPANTKQAVADSEALTKYLKTVLSDVKVTYIKDPRGFQNTIITASYLKRPNRSSRS